MIRIFNNKIERIILIDDTIPAIRFEPKEWIEDNPHIEIKISGFDFNKHCRTCQDCEVFRKAFGTETKDWYIEYMGKIRQLDLAEFGSKFNQNLSRVSNSNSFYGTILRLRVDTIETLSEKLKLAEELQNYEVCIIMRDSINLMRENINRDK